MPPPSRNPRGRSRSSESRLMLESKNDEDVDDLLLFTEMKKHESESSEEITHFSAHRRDIGDSLKASDGGKNEYNWLLTPPGTPLNGTDQEPKPIDNPRNKARTRTDTTPRRSMNGKAQTRGTVATTRRDAKREPCRQLSSGDITAIVGGTNSHPHSFNLLSLIEEVPFPANRESEQTFGRVIDSQEASVDTSKHEKACGDATPMSTTQKSRFEKDVLDQNAHVWATKSETAAELSKTTEAPGGAQRNFASEEATDDDAILLCNSIVHDLIGSENQMALTEISHPSLEQSVKSASDLKYLRYAYYKNLQRFNRKRQEFDIKKVLGDLRTDAKSKEHVKPLKVESKCNCSIM